MDASKPPLERCRQRKKNPPVSQGWCTLQYKNCDQYYTTPQSKMNLCRTSITTNGSPDLFLSKCSITSSNTISPKSANAWASSSRLETIKHSLERPLDIAKILRLGWLCQKLCCWFDATRKMPNAPRKANSLRKSCLVDVSRARVAHLRQLGCSIALLEIEISVTRWTKSRTKKDAHIPHGNHLNDSVGHWNVFLHLNHA